MDEKQRPIPTPRNIRIAVKITLISVISVLIALFIYLMRDMQVTQDETVKPAESESAVESQTDEKEEGQGSIVGNFARYWDAMRDELYLRDKENIDLNDVDEEKARQAAGLIKRLINLDPEKNDKAISKLLADIKAIGYPAGLPILEMMDEKLTERQLLLLLRALESVEEVKVTEPLKKIILSNPSSAVRAKAREIFANRSTEIEKQTFANEIRSNLSSTANASSDDKRFYLIEALAISSGVEAADMLRKIAVYDSNAQSRKQAVSSLGNLNNEAAYDVLLEIMTNEASLRKNAVQALSQNASPYISDRILAILNRTDDKQIKLAAISVLGAQNDDAARNYLLDILQNSRDNDLLQAAANAAGNWKSEEMSRSVLTLLETADNPRQKRSLIVTLGRMGENAVGTLEMIASDPNAPLNDEAIAALARINSPKAHDSLMKILDRWKDYSTASQQSLLIGLKNFKETNAVPSIESIFWESPHAHIRRLALETVSSIREGEEMPFVIQAFEKDETDMIKRAALRMMGRYGDQETASYLRQQLLQNNFPRVKDSIEKTIQIIEMRKK